MKKHVFVIVAGLLSSLHLNLNCAQKSLELHNFEALFQSKELLMPAITGQKMFDAYLKAFENENIDSRKAAFFKKTLFGQEQLFHCMFNRMLHPGEPYTNKEYALKKLCALEPNKKLAFVQMMCEFIEDPISQELNPDSPSQLLLEMQTTFNQNNGMLECLPKKKNTLLVLVCMKKTDIEIRFKKKYIQALACRLQTLIAKKK